MSDQTRISVSGLFMGLACGLIALIVLFLIGAEILSAPDLPWQEVEQSAIGTARADEVRSYTLFTTVKLGTSNVTTGTRYRSTDNRVIDGQWCYIIDTTAQAKGEGATQVVLVNVDELGIRTVPEYKAETLEKFGLTPTKARGLINSHCRFQ